jgi:ubiquinone/menaquinone biosynthesis C-methylase UbiE
MDESGVLRSIEAHYGRGTVLDGILRALAAAGKDLEHLSQADLAPVDQFHVRGHEATLELAALAALQPGERLLDVGSGLGGSVRYLVQAYGVRATGVDLTQEYVDAARALARLAGFDGRVEFRQSNALALPFDDASFDVVWTEHVQMNVADKRAFYAGLSRVLAPRGRLVFHDIFQGPGGAPRFPVPWAEDASMSFLATPEDARALLEEIGFRIEVWRDRSDPAQAWFEASIERLAAAPVLPPGIHLLMGETAPAKIRNMASNLAEGRIRSIQAVCVRR